MKQVLLSMAGRHPIPPALMWMGDNVHLGDIFLWRKRVCTVSAIYGTHLSAHGAEAGMDDRPRHYLQAAVVLDEHPN